MMEKSLGLPLEQRVHTVVINAAPTRRSPTNDADYMAQHAETQGREALANARTTMERALAELDHYIARYEEVEGLKNKANVLNWTLNHLATYVPNNVRLDLIAGAQAELIRVDARR